MIDIKKLFSLEYLLQPQPVADSVLVFALAIFFCLVIIASGIIWIWFWKRERHEPIYQFVRSRWVNYLFTLGFVGLILIFFRWQGIAYLSSRTWLVLWLLIGLIWLVRIWRYLLKKFPEERRLYHERITRERYLPKAKNV